MTSSNDPLSLPLNDDELPRTIIYDPNDPFWRDTEDDDNDDDDMDFVPAMGGSEDDEEEGDVNFHGRYDANCMFGCRCIKIN